MLVLINLVRGYSDFFENDGELLILPSQFELCESSINPYPCGSAANYCMTERCLNLFYNQSGVSLRRRNFLSPVVKLSDSSLNFHANKTLAKRVIAQGSRCSRIPGVARGTYWLFATADGLVVTFIRVRYPKALIKQDGSERLGIGPTARVFILVSCSDAVGGLRSAPSVHVVVTSEHGLYRISHRTLSSLSWGWVDVGFESRLPRPESSSETHFSGGYLVRILENLEQAVMEPPPP